jgi:Holliday junction resolvase
MRQTEAAFQRKLIKQYEADGWYVLKIIQSNKPGWPDLLLLKSNQYRLIEVKTTDGRISPIQTYRHAELQKLGIPVHVIKPCP